jgi:hypothetical protein
MISNPLPNQGKNKMHYFDEIAIENDGIKKLKKKISEILCSITKLNHIDLTIDINDSVNGNNILIVESNRLQDYMYPKMFKRLILSNFGGSWTFDEDDEDLYYLPIHYRYDHFNKGSNGTSCAEFFITKNLEIKHYVNNLHESPIVYKNIG